MVIDFETACDGGRLRFSVGSLAQRERWISGGTGGGRELLESLTACCCCYALLRRFCCCCYVLICRFCC